MEPKEGLSEALPQPENAGEKVEKRAETAASAESAPNPQKPAALPKAPQDIPTANPVNLPTTTDDNSADATTDADKPAEEKVVEKQWVERAKQIVEQTKDDPFKQNYEVSKVKAEYIKQRFSKTIKTDTGTA